MGDLAWWAWSKDRWTGLSALNLSQKKLMHLEEALHGLGSKMSPWEDPLAGGLI